MCNFAVSRYDPFDESEGTRGDRTIRELSVAKLLSPYTPHHLIEALEAGDDERWLQAAALMDLHGDRVGDYLFAHIRTFAQGVDDRAFWHWIDLSDKVLELHEHRQGLN